jgi:16S rRNA (cytosine1402-N4)-methyltransferase
MNNTFNHVSVMLSEVIVNLDPSSNKKYIDATLGGAGHTKALLDKGAAVLGLDQDKDALAYVQSSIKNPALTVAEANFMTIKTQAQKYGFEGCDGVLFDLGVSSFQLDTPDRGFSFQHEALLDMRMNQSSDGTAADIVNNNSEDELFELLMTNAQEPKSRSIAHAIVTHRPIHTTTELARLIETVYGGRRGHIHPATRTFQAIRIAVNQELKIIKPAIKDAFSVLKLGGRIAVISFHEGEDRIVKRTFSELVDAGQAKVVGQNPQAPSAEEIKNNARARSAKLRTIERI